MSTRPTYCPGLALRRAGLRRVFAMLPLFVLYLHHRHGFQQAVSHAVVRRVSRAVLRRRIARRHLTDRKARATGRAADRVRPDDVRLWRAGTGSVCAILAGAWADGHRSQLSASIGALFGALFPKPLTLVEARLLLAAPRREHRGDGGATLRRMATRGAQWQRLFSGLRR